MVVTRREMVGWKYYVCCKCTTNMTSWKLKVILTLIIACMAIAIICCGVYFRNGKVRKWTHKK